MVIPICCVQSTSGHATIYEATHLDANVIGELLQAGVRVGEHVLVEQEEHVRPVPASHPIDDVLFILQINPARKKSCLCLCVCVGISGLS